MISVKGINEKFVKTRSKDGRDKTVCEIRCKMKISEELTKAERLAYSIMLKEIINDRFQMKLDLFSEIEMKFRGVAIRYCEDEYDESIARSISSARAKESMNTAIKTLCSELTNKLEKGCDYASETKNKSVKNISNEIAYQKKLIVDGKKQES